MLCNTPCRQSPSHQYVRPEDSGQRKTAIVEEKGRQAFSLRHCTCGQSCRHGGPLDPALSDLAGSLRLYLPQRQRGDGSILVSKHGVALHDSAPCCTRTDRQVFGAGLRLITTLKAWNEWGEDAEMTEIQQWKLDVQRKFL